MRTRFWILPAALILLICGIAAAQPQEKVIWNFKGAPNDGAYSLGGLISDSAGNLYGTTMGGGYSPSGCLGIGCGTVFELSPGPNGSWTETVLYKFCQDGSICPDGANPHAGLVMNAAGNLYGTTEYGGTGTCFTGCGVVFELAPPSLPGESWTYSTLYTFCPIGNCQDGGNPRFGALVLDTQGNLYGTTSVGGTSFGGTVFELSLGNNGWSLTTLYSFCIQKQNGQCLDGADPEGGVAFDNSGNLYGTTFSGGLYSHNSPLGNGVIYKLSPHNNSWHQTVLHAFAASGAHGSGASASVTIDRGTLYGTFSGVYGGNPSGAFRMNLAHGFGELLFTGADGGDLRGKLLIDSATNTAYGTTIGGGGSVFKVTPPSQVTTLYTFCQQPNCADGQYPDADVIKDSAGNLYGTTVNGGSFQQGSSGTNGVVFEITP